MDRSGTPLAPARHRPVAPFARAREGRDRAGYQGRAVAVRKLRATTGSGTRKWDETVEGYLYFGERWLSKHALEARHCRVARAVGASMEPTLPDGCSILVDLQGKEFRDGAVFVASTGDGIVARRAAEFSDGRQLVSDDGQSAPVRWQGSSVIGEVRWIARTVQRGGPGLLRTGLVRCRSQCLRPGAGKCQLTCMPAYDPWSPAVSKCFLMAANCIGPGDAVVPASDLPAPPWLSGASPRSP